jgi:dihydroorotate dehydrogenase (fumarate)
VMLASALLELGPQHLRVLEHGITEWMAEREYESVAQLQGSMSQGAVADPSAFERANYLRTLRWGKEAFRR